VRNDGTLAVDLFIYMDDFRPTGPSKEECWQGAQQVGSRLSWFGLQNASRKRTAASQTYGFAHRRSGCHGFDVPGQMGEDK